MNAEQAKRHKVARVKCDNDLMFFTRYFFKVRKGKKFIVNHHHQTICDSLNKIEDYSLEFLNINIPPRYSKTELAAVNFIARGLCKNPHSNYLYITASDELRSQTSVDIREIIQSEECQTMYGIELKKDQNAKNLWRTKEGGGVKTATIFGQITGFGAGQMTEEQELLDEIRNFEGCIVLDDINKIDDTETDNATNEKVTRVVFNTILSRKNSHDTPIINIQQRAGLKDITAEFMDHYKGNDKAEFLVMPVIKDGVPLWEWKHSKEKIEEIKTSRKTSHVFSTQYMQKPVALKGLLFPEESLKRFSLNDLDRDAVEAKHSNTDTADEGKDYWATGFVENIGKAMYLTDVIFTQDNADICIPRLSQKVKDGKFMMNQIEVNREGRMVVKLVRQALQDDSIDLVSLWSKSNKHTRILMAAGTIKEYVHFRNDYEPESEYDQFMDMLTTYAKDGSTKQDDAPDMLTGLVNFVTYSLDHIYDD